MKVGLLITSLLWLFGLAIIDGFSIEVEELGFSNDEAHKLKRELDIGQAEEEIDSRTNDELAEMGNGAAKPGNFDGVPSLRELPKSLDGAASLDNLGNSGSITESKLRRLAEDSIEGLKDDPPAGGKGGSLGVAPAAAGNPLLDAGKKIISDFESHVMPHLEEADYDGRQVKPGESDIAESEHHSIGHKISEHHWPDKDEAPQGGSNKGQKMPEQNAAKQQEQVQDVIPATVTVDEEHFEQSGQAANEKGIQSSPNEKRPESEQVVAEDLLPGTKEIDEERHRSKSEQSASNPSSADADVPVKKVEEVPQEKSDTGLVEPNKAPPAAVNIQEPTANKESPNVGSAGSASDELDKTQQNAAGPTGKDPPGKETPASTAENAGNAQPVNVRGKGSAGSVSMGNDPGSESPSASEAGVKETSGVPSVPGTGDVAKDPGVQTLVNRKRREVPLSPERNNYENDDRLRELRYGEFYANGNGMPDVPRQSQYLRDENTKDRNPQPYSDKEDREWKTFRHDQESASSVQEYDWKDDVPEKGFPAADNLVPFAGAVRHLKALHLVEDCLREYLHSENLDRSEISILLLEPKVVSYVKDCYYDSMESPKHDAIARDHSTDQQSDKDPHDCTEAESCLPHKVHDQKRNEDSRVVAKDYFHNVLAAHKHQPVIPDPGYERSMNPKYQNPYHPSQYDYPPSFAAYGQAEPADATPSGRQPQHMFQRPNPHDPAIMPPRNQLSLRQHQKFPQDPYMDFYPLSDRPYRLPSAPLNYYHMHRYDRDTYNVAPEYGYLESRNSA